MCRDLYVKLLKHLSFPETLLSLTPVPSTQGACLEMVALRSSVKPRFLLSMLPWQAARTGTEEDSSKLGPCLQLRGEENRQT